MYILKCAGHLHKRRSIGYTFWFWCEYRLYFGPYIIRFFSLDIVFTRHMCLRKPSVVRTCSLTLKFHGLLYDWKCFMSIGNKIHDFNSSGITFVEHHITILWSSVIQHVCTAFRSSARLCVSVLSQLFLFHSNRISPAACWLWPKLFAYWSVHCVIL